MAQVYDEEFRKKNDTAPCARRTHVQKFGDRIRRLQSNHFQMVSRVQQRMPRKWRRRKNAGGNERNMSAAKTSAGAGKGERVPKKSGGILCKGNPVELYTFITQNKGTFGLRWLLNKLRIFPNAYYNFLRNRKKAYRERKTKILALIEEIYHSHNGVDGYRKMRVYLQRHRIFFLP